MTQPDDSGVLADTVNDVDEPRDLDVQAGLPAPVTTDTSQPPASNDADDQDDANEPGNADSAARKARREAAGLRRRLKEVEVERDELTSERDELRDTLTSTRQFIVDGIAAQHLADPSLLAREGYELESLLGDDGSPNTAKIEQACSEVVRKHRIAPLPKRPAPNYQQGRAAGQPRDPDTFAKAFAPPKR